MPIYEYQCDDCHATLEKLQKLSDGPLTDCPECGKSALRKLISAPSFRLKGGGWYETDFKKDKQKNLHDSAHGEGKSKDSESQSEKSQSAKSKSDAGKKDGGKESAGSSAGESSGKSAGKSGGKSSASAD